MAAFPARFPLMEKADTAAGCRQRKLRRNVLLASCVAAILSWAASPLAAPVTGAETRSGHLKEVRERGKLVMLCFPHQDSTFVHPKLDALRELRIPLKDLRDPDHFEGSDVDLLRAFAASLGVRLEIRPVTTSYADLIPALLAGDGDVIASSLTITEEREKVVDFSVPYAKSWVAVVVSKDTAVENVDDLAGLTGALMKGSSQLEFLRSVGPDDVKILLTDFSLENYISVAEGTADFTLVDSAAEVGTTPNESFPDLRVAFRLREFNYGVVVPPGSDLLPPLNAFLAERTSVRD